MKYDDNILKYYGIKYSIIYNEVYQPEIIIENISRDIMRVKTTMIQIMDLNAIDNAIDKFLIESRKEKLQKLNEI